MVQIISGITHRPAIAYGRAITRSVIVKRLIVDQAVAIAVRVIDVRDLVNIVIVIGVGLPVGEHSETIAYVVIGVGGVDVRAVGVVQTRYRPT